MPGRRSLRPRGGENGWLANNPKHSDSRYLSTHWQPARQQGLPLGSVVLHDLLLPARLGTAQVDHVAFSPSGVWAIETKNWTMEVHGAEDDYRWSWRAGSLPNPVLQVRRHARVVARILDVPVWPVVALAEPGAVHPDSPAVLGTSAAAAGVIARAPREPGWSPEAAGRLAARLKGAALPGTRAERVRHHAFCRAASAG